MDKIFRRKKSGVAFGVCWWFRARGLQGALLALPVRRQLRGRLLWLLALAGLFPLPSGGRVGNAEVGEAFCFQGAGQTALLTGAGVSRAQGASLCGGPASAQAIIC